MAESATSPLDDYLDRQALPASCLPRFAALSAGLQQGLRLIAAAPVPMAIFVGPELRCFYNPAYGTLLGASHPAAFGQPAAGHLQDAGADMAPMLREVLARGRPIHSPDQQLCVTRRGAPASAYFDIALSPIRAADGKVEAVFALLTETTARVDARRVQELLLHEMKHRVKNILATVLAIARQTLGDRKDLHSKAFTERVLALARAQDLVTKTAEDGAQLQDLVVQIISPYAPERIHYAGPPVDLSSQMVMSLTLALHELATNAAKYGALSVESGRIELQWQLVAQGDAARILDLSWIESDGPLVVEPARRGFGTILLRDVPKLELQADILLEFHPAGLRYRAKIPLAPQG